MPTTPRQPLLQGHRLDVHRHPAPRGPLLAAPPRECSKVTIGQYASQYHAPLVKSYRAHSFPFVMRPRTPRSHSELGQRVSEALRGMSMSQIALAQRVGVHETAVSKWAAGRPPSARLVPRIASVLGVSVEFLMTGKESRQLLREVDGDARAISLVPAAAASEPLAQLGGSGDLETFHFPRHLRPPPLSRHS